MENANVILVDENDKEIGSCEKLEAHQQGWLHRAFSIFIFNRRGEMLLQQRALNKYHSPGLWTNACCSHPAPGEKLEEAASRRLEEELGISTSLEKRFDFIYRAEFENGLTEYEFDHVLVGEYEGNIDFNKEEVMDIAWKDVRMVEQELEADPSKFSAWFKIAFQKMNNICR